MLKRLPFIIAVCVGTLDQNCVNDDNQQALMTKAVGIVQQGNIDDEAVMSVLVGGKSVHEVCQWRGVTCNKKDTVGRISWTKTATKRDETPTELKFLYLQWIPSTVHDLIVREQKVIDETLDTRQLPRDLVNLTIYGCGLNGTVDMTGLPAHVETINLEGNRISGTVFLGNLPRSLRIIEMTWNPIRLVVVDNDGLPDGFEFAKFASSKKPRATEVTGKKVDRRIRRLHVGLYNGSGASYGSGAVRRI